MLRSDQIADGGGEGHRPRGLVEVRNDSVISYLPNADFQLWIKPVLKSVAIFCAAAPFFIYFLNTIGMLTPVMSIAVEYLRLFKDFLTSSSASAAVLWLGYLQTLSLPVFLLLGGWLAFVVVKLGQEPNLIAMSKTGMIFGRTYQKDRDYTSLFVVKNIEWMQVLGIEIVRPAYTRSNRDYCFQFDVGRKKPLKVRIGDIVNTRDRQAFLNIIKGRFKNFVDDEALEVFYPPKDRQSYTELWLAELSAPPKRDRLTPLEVGARVFDQKYQVISKLGVGGQGTVYLAASTFSSAEAAEEVVLKEFVLPVFPDTTVRKAAAVRFQDEATLLTKLDHPQIVKLKELFLEDHRAYLVLEHLTGENLKDLVSAQGPLPTKEIFRLAGQMCDILIYLHGQSPPVVHRDFTPDNLILDQDGLVKLIDFSVAQSFTSNVTGSVVGKPHYIAPEQFRGKPTAQSDIYSMGATLFYLATGQEPEPITNLRLAEVDTKADQTLAKIIEKATKLDVASRCQSAAELLKMLPGKK